MTCSAAISSVSGVFFSFGSNSMSDSDEGVGDGARDGDISGGRGMLGRAGVFVNGVVGCDVMNSY